MLAGAGLLVAAGAAPAGGIGDAERFLPADGTAQWMHTSTDAAAHVREHERAGGITPLLGFPALARDLALRSYDDPDIAAVPHWVVNALTPDESAQRRDLYRLDDTGVRLVLSTGAPTAVLFAPGLLALPADVAPGATWESEGTALFATGGDDGPRAAEVAYAARFTARTPEDPVFAEFAAPGCLEVAAVNTLTWPGDIPADEIEEGTLWCPGQGVVASWSSMNGDAPTVTVPADPADAASVAASSVPRWDPAGWGASEVAVSAVDPAFGTAPTEVTPVLPPVRLGDGWAVPEDASGSIVLLEPDGDGLVVRGLAHPGGDITALGAASGLVVAATTTRDLVAYTASARRAWRMGLDDLVIVPPVAGTDGSVFVAGLDGRVRAVDAGTGAERWQVVASGDGLTRLTAAGDVVVAADTAGRVIALDAATGDTLWTAEGEALEALAATADAVLVARDLTLERRAARAGTVVWSAEIDDPVADIAVAGTDVVLSTSGGLVAVSAASGAARWTAPAGAAIVGDGATVLVRRGEEVAVVEDDGADGAAWTLPTAGGMLVAGADAAWWFGGADGIERIGP